MVILFLLFIRSWIIRGFDVASVNRAEIQIFEVVCKDFIASFRVDGRVVPSETYQVEAPVGGMIESINKSIGDFVTKGDTLIILTNDDLQLQLIHSETEVANQINNLSMARIQRNQSSLAHRRLHFSLQRQINKEQREFAATEGLYERGLISEDEYLTSLESLEILLNNYTLSVEEARIDSLIREQQIVLIEQSLNQVQMNLDQMRNKVHDLIILSPMEGQITDLNLTTGQMLHSGSKIAFIENNTKFYIQARINQYYQEHLFPGAKAVVTNFSEPVFITIDNIHPRLEGDLLVVNFIGELPGTVRSGQLANIEAQTSIVQEAVVIPMGLYLSENQFRSVFVIDQSQTTAERRFIETGKRTFREVEVLNGLDPGEMIIISSNPAWSQKNILKIK